MWFRILITVGLFFQCALCMAQVGDWKSRFLVFHDSSSESIMVESQILDQIANLIETDDDINSMFTFDEIEFIQDLKEHVHGPLTFAILNHSNDLDDAFAQLQSRAKKALPDVWATVGQERINAVSIRCNNNWLERATGSKSKISAIFESAAISDVLEISNTQQKKAADIVELFVSSNNDLRKHYLDEFEQSRNVLYKAIQRQLEIHQKTRLASIIGTPLDIRLWLDENTEDGVTLYNGADPTSNIVSTTTIFEPGSNSKPDVRREKIEVDYMLRYLLQSKTAQIDMELTKNQLGDIEKFFDPMSHVIVDKFDNKERRIDQLLANTIDHEKLFPAFVLDILLKHQLVWVRRVELQFRTSEYFESFGILHPKVTQILELSKQQQDAIRALVSQHTNDVKTFRATWTDSSSALQTQLKSDLTEILNTNQINQISHFIGK